MKVLIIPSWYPYEAMPHAGRFFVEQATALAHDGRAEISILNWGQNALQLKIREPRASIKKLIRFRFGKLPSSGLAEGVNEIAIPHLTWTSHILKGNLATLAKKIVLKDKPDIIHAHVSFPAGYLAMLLSQKYQIPYIITEHSGPFPLSEHERKGRLSALVSQPLHNAAKVVAVSNFLVAEIQRKTSVHPMVIPNLVDTAYFCPSTESTAINKQFRFFALTPFTEAKGALDLIEAVKQLKHAGVQFRLRWGGSGKLENEVKNRIIRYNLQQEIIFLGTLGKEASLMEYRNCDCFIMPSHLESFSMVLIEAMACGCPLIATASGGPQDIVEESMGLLVPPSSPKQLSDAMYFMAEHIQDFDRAYIREECVKRYSSSVVAKQIMVLYQEVLGKA